ncbi:FISUMP domain-containing protein [Sphingobacterium sp. NGMCC 1.201703]|uniref:FISUMP domain-containing protein n=1 Tax=Sphingobacterium sp. NGMCC 1.201703 TaxID=3388657 RepID=UPI0039FC31ED
MLKNSIKYSSLLLAFIISLGACKKEQGDTLPKGKAAIRVNLSGAEFDQGGVIGSKASTGSTASTSQRQVVAISKELSMVTELVPASQRETVRKNASVDGKRAAVVQEDLPANVKYKVAVYDAAENYVTERDYTRGQESSTEALILNGGENYTFIAYSVGSTSVLPAITFSDANNKTLAGSSVMDVNADSTDLMYFRKDMQLVSDADNHLEVVLKHQFSEITTKVDASATGYNIVDIRGGIYDHYAQADIALQDAAITRKGTVGEAGLDFSGLNTMVVNAAPRKLNANTTTGMLHFSGFAIGEIRVTNLTALENLSITPGVKYNLNLTIVPNDIYLTYQGQSAARINGKIWMRHNLGANTDVNPDLDPVISSLGGNFYQFGRSAVVANASSSENAISNWNTTAAPANAWNSGTTTTPQKTANDPCPSGYRIPSKNEYDQLLQDMSVSNNSGTWGTTSANVAYGPAKILTSKRNRSVILTFPASGFRDSRDGKWAWRGGSGPFWTSERTTVDQVYRLSILRDIATVRNTANVGHTAVSGYSVRCIAE